MLVGIHNAYIGKQKRIISANTVHNAELEGGNCQGIDNDIIDHSLLLVVIQHNTSDLKTAFLTVDQIV
jgi:hypothetical protein